MFAGHTIILIAVKLKPLTKGGQTRTKPPACKQTVLQLLRRVETSRNIKKT